MLTCQQETLPAQVLIHRTPKENPHRYPSIHAAIPLEPIRPGKLGIPLKTKGISS